MKAAVHRLFASSPSDTSGLDDAIARGGIRPQTIAAVLGKTEGNGCVNDFTRGFATVSFRTCLSQHLGVSAADVEAQVALVMSGGTEGGLSPHWLVFTVDRVRETAPAHNRKSLAVGIAFTRAFHPEEIGRRPQAVETAQAVKLAMADAAIVDSRDVHFVQVKCPLITASRVAEAAARGRTVATMDTYESMGFSRGASALGIAMALGESASTDPFTRKWVVMCMRTLSTCIFSMCPYRDTWVMSQNAIDAVKYASGVGAEPRPPSVGPTSQAKV